MSDLLKESVSPKVGIPNGNSTAASTAPANKHNKMNIFKSNITSSLKSLNKRKSDENTSFNSQINNQHTGNSVNETDEDSLSMSDLSDSEDSDFEEEKLTREEDVKDYKQGGYHPTYIGETYGEMNQYLIVRKLGWGYFSTVWLAYDNINSTHVAIKIVRSSKNYKEAAIDEIKILERISKGSDSHPGKDHVVRLLDHFVHKGPNGEHICMVFEVLGENMLSLLIRYKIFQKEKTEELNNLQNQNQLNNSNGNIGSSSISYSLSDLAVLRESYGGLPLSLVKQIIKQILLALDYLHRYCGLIHTDLKPENILVEISDVEKLVKMIEKEAKNAKFQKLLEKREEAKKLQKNDPLLATRSRSSTKLPIKNGLHFHSHSHSQSSSRRRSVHSKTRSQTINSPIRCSKPLTSPIANNSSFDNFFKSFSFSKEPRANSVSSQYSNSNILLPRKNSIRSPSFSSINHLNTDSSENNNVNGNNINTTISNQSNLSTSIPLTLDNNGKSSPITSQVVTPSQDTNTSHSNLNITTETILEEESSDEEGEEQIFVDAIDEPQPPTQIKSQLSKQLASLNGSPVIVVANNSSNDIAHLRIDTSTPSKDLPNSDSELSSTTDTNPISTSSIAIPLPKHQLRTPTPTLPQNASFARASEVSNSSFSDLDNIISVKLADLGNACYNNLHFTNDIQTRQYRSPEVILGGKWGCSTDIWSFGCMIFELITGDYLFDPKEGASYTKDDDHLAQIIELLNYMPSKDFLKRCKYSREFFDKSYTQLKNIGNLKIWQLESVLSEKYHMDKELASQTAEFMSHFLEFEPKKRWDAGSLSNHPFLDDCNIFKSIDRKLGMRGQDIQGYLMETE